MPGVDEQTVVQRLPLQQYYTRATFGAGSDDLEYFKVTPQAAATHLTGIQIVKVVLKASQGCLLWLKSTLPLASAVTGAPRKLHSSAQRTRRYTLWSSVRSAAPHSRSTLVSSAPEYLHSVHPVTR